MNLFASCYTRLERRRGWLVLALVLLLGGGLWQLTRLQLEDSIVAMLPDGDSHVAADFQRLQQAPFARKLVIQLRAAPGIDSEVLLAATDRLRAALPRDLFQAALTGPGELQSGPLFQQLGDFLPVLLDESDREQLAAQLTAAGIDRQLAHDLALLLQPQGIALKERIRRDPLDLQRLALGKLRSLNPLPGVRLKQGHFLSSDERSSLILADTPVLITDLAGGERLLAAFERARQELPEGISAALLSGHPYTQANTRVIQQDMRLVLLVSTLGILLLFLLFLRSLRALAVFLLPLLSMLAALLVVSFWYGRLSGITIGFGAVLLGITIDFALHVYFALRYGQGPRVELLRAVSRPVLFGGLTTLAAFAVLLGSALPGQRQLALFAMAGIVAALLLALLVLPHFLGDAAVAERRKAFRRHLFDRRPGLRLTVLAVWLLLAVGAAIGAQRLTINGELRQLGYVPQPLRQAEQALQESWGNLRGRALIFTAGADLESALQRNEQVWQLLGRRQLQADAVSLAPLLPSQLSQRQRLQQWESFWREHRVPTEELIRGSAAGQGFSPAAFAPFFQYLDQPAALLEPARLRDWGLGGLLDNLLLDDGQGVQLLTLLPDRPDQLVELEAELTRIPGVTLVSQSRFSRQLSREIGADFTRFILLAGGAVLLLLLLLFRRLPDVLLALLPVLTGLLVMFGAMGLLGVAMNLFNLVASILIIGLGVDYGIFMVCHGRQQDLASARAVVVSGLTTLVGFGALVLARHPALHSIGLTVLLGIGAAVPTAVLVIPALRPKRR